MPGKPYSGKVLQQKPYVVQKIEGKFVDKYGKVVSRKALDAHIPLEQFIYNSELR